MDQVISYYKGYHPKFKGTQKGERKLIQDRLDEDFSVADLCRAIEGNHQSRWHCGQNKDNARHNQLELIVRNGAKVNMFIEKLEEASMPTVSKEGQQTIAAAQRFVERKKNAQS